MLNDHGLSTDQYNYGMMIFYLCFLSAEVPIIVSNYGKNFQHQKVPVMNEGFNGVLE